MSYTLDQLCKLGANLEGRLSPFGIHVAIGGSCLYRGHSDKDMDVFLYPHTNKDIDKNAAIEELVNLGFSLRDIDSDSHYPSTQIPDVIVTHGPNNERVDFFVLSRYNSIPCDETVDVGVSL